MLSTKPDDVMNAEDIYRLRRTSVTKNAFIDETIVACRLVNECANTHYSQIELVVNVLS